VRYEVRVAGRTLRVDLDASGRYLVDGNVVAAEVQAIRGHQWLIRIDGRSHEVTLLTLTRPLRLAIDGTEIDAEATDERTLAASRAMPQHPSGRHEVRAPMPGLLRAVHVKEGDIVERDAPLMTLEAMKMENELRAPARSRVVKVTAAAGAKVEGGAVLAVLSDVE
jgi:biotin carboxyl carrier protein